MRSFTKLWINGSRHFSIILMEKKVNLIEKSQPLSLTTAMINFDLPGPEIAWWEMELREKKASPFLFRFTENKDQTILLLKISFCIIVTKKAIFANGCNFTLDIYYSQKCNVNPFCKSSARHQLLHNPNNIITTNKEPH